MLKLNDVEKRLDDYHYQHYKNGKKYEFASLAFGELYQLAAALAYLERVGLPQIETHTLALVAQLRKGLADRKFRIFTPEGSQSSIIRDQTFRPSLGPDNSTFRMVDLLLFAFEGKKSLLAPLG